MSTNEKIQLQEETLDPQDWQAMRNLGHQMVDEMMNYLETVRERPVWQPIPDEVKEFFKQPLPQQPEGSEQTYQDFKSNIMPYPLGNISPKFWGWVMGNGTPFGMLAEMLTAGMNFNVGGGEQISNQVELQVLDWCKEMLGFPMDASGLLTSGCTMANIIGLTIARNTKAGFDVRKQGLLNQAQMTVYASEQVHNWLDKGVELIGLGNHALRKIPVNANYEIDIESLKQTIAEDKAAGLKPICIVGTAGTVNTGATDDLNALADIAAQEDIWFHIDGA
jgi:glutamate/tyrosine decarboxylase-like PLP-dependent enzyme